MFCLCSCLVRDIEERDERGDGKWSGGYVCRKVVNMVKWPDVTRNTYV